MNKCDQSQVKLCSLNSKTTDTVVLLAMASMTGSKMMQLQPSGCIHELCATLLLSGVVTNNCEMGVMELHICMRTMNTQCYCIHESICML